MSLKLSRIKKGHLISALDWREDCLKSLRTSDFILDSSQEKFYENLCDRSDIKLYSVVVDNLLVAVCGFVNINHINRMGEISLLMNPKVRGLGFGKKVLDLLLDKGFNHLGFENIYGETYTCNDYYGFWLKYIDEKNLYSTILPNRKLYDGKMHDGLYFNIEKEKVA